MGKRPLKPRYRAYETGTSTRSPLRYIMRMNTPRVVKRPIMSGSPPPPRYNALCHAEKLPGFDRTGPIDWAKAKTAPRYFPSATGDMGPMVLHTMDSQTPAAMNMLIPLPNPHFF